MFTRTRLALSAVVLTGGLVAGTAPSAGALPHWGTAPVDRADTQPWVTDLRYARHQHYDRVVIDLRGRVPGYSVRYTDQLRRQGSGRLVHLPGHGKVSVTLSPAVSHDRSGDSVYDGPRYRRVHFATLRGIAFTGDLEGQVTFGLSTDRRAPYRVFTLTHPSRLVIDFRH